MNIKEEIREYILDYIQKKNMINKNEDLEKFNYIESGYIDSLEIVKFIVELEDEFNIEFSDEELESESFKIVGELIKIIEGKVKCNE